MSRKPAQVSVGDTVRLRILPNDLAVVVKVEWPFFRGYWVCTIQYADGTTHQVADFELVKEKD